jgi:hypothetical protein
MGQMSAKDSWGIAASFASKHDSTQPRNHPGTGMVKKAEPPNSCHSHRPGFMPPSSYRNHSNSILETSIEALQNRPYASIEGGSRIMTTK